MSKELGIWLKKGVEGEIGSKNKETENKVVEEESWTKKLIIKYII